jgi:hypothetical protein
MSLDDLRNHALRSANGTFAEFSRESCLDSHVMHVPFRQVRSRDLQLLSNAVIAVRYTGICLQEIGGALPVPDASAEPSRHMRIVPRRGHNNTWTCASSWYPQGGPMRTRTRADRLERLQCQVAARNHTKLRFGLSIAETLRLGRELAHERNHAGSAAQGGKIATDISP